MLKTNYCKSVTDILYEEHEDWHNTSNIIIKYYDWSTKKFEESPIKAKKDLNRQFKSYIGHVRANFDEMGEMLLARKFNGIMHYKRATKKDAEYIIAELNKSEKRKIRAKECFEIKLENVKKNNLIPEYKELELDLLTN